LGRGICDVGTGGGKTRIAAGVAFVAGGEWVYLVYGRDLVAQARRSFLELGQLLGGELKLEAWSWGQVPDRLLAGADGLLVDEVHQAGARTRAQVVGKFRGGWRVGLSGTPLDRTDERNGVVLGLFGGVVAEIGVGELTDRGQLSPGRVVMVSFLGG
jgi:superfamily II DNA or RNA helicase